VRQKRDLCNKIEVCTRNGMCERRKMTTAVRNNLGFDLSVLIICGSRSWGPNGQ
jgi:hypothetical protein